MFMEKGMSPIDRELSKKVVKIIHSLLMMQQSAAFRKPVPHKALGLEDYKLIIKKPTDLNLIRRQYNEGKYKFVEEVLDDIQLCWDNCKLYNAIGSQIYNQALFMEQAFDKQGLQVLPDFWSGINREEYNQKFNIKKIEEDKKKPQIKSSIQKVQHATSLKEQMRMKKEKKVTFNPKNNQEDNVNEEGAQQVFYDKDRQDIVEHEQIQSHPPSVPHVQKVSMDVQQGQEHQQTVVQPIMVSLSEHPAKEQLLQLSQQVKNLYSKQDFAMLQKVLQILHSNEKQNMKISKNGQMSFEMNKIHISTFYRLKKLLGMSQQNIVIIE